MLEFVDSDLYFVQDKHNFINPLLQPKITGSGSSSLPTALYNALKTFGLSNFIKNGFKFCKSSDFANVDTHSQP